VSPGRPAGPPPLRIYEAVLLLAVHDEKGTFHSSMHTHALAGAVITELVLEGRLATVAGRRKREFLEVQDPAPTGDPVMDGALDRIRQASRRATVATWVGRLAVERGFRHRAAGQVVARGLLERVEGRVLGLFRRVRYPTVDADPEARLVEGLRRVLDGADTSDPRLPAVLALADAGGILRHVFDRGYLRARRDRLKAIRSLEGMAIPEATRAAVAATQAAVVASITAATAAAAAG
jgi:golgi phosphoprotein 3